jgi:hypothetical protein
MHTILCAPIVWLERESGVIVMAKFSAEVFVASIISPDLASQSANSPILFNFRLLHDVSVSCMHANP